MIAVRQAKIKISMSQKLGLLTSYLKKRLVSQIKAVALIVIYLICFQTLVLDIAIGQSTVMTTGIIAVVFGLTFFMEGLFLGLMPLGEIIGLKLPRKAPLGITLLFAFILGMGATFAEPAIGILKAAGMSVKPWEAPLLFVILNQRAALLVYSVGIGVGIAVLFGMLRFLNDWSLKPFIYVLVSILIAFTGWAFTQPNMQHLTGLAWDCGAVTTGPVTVPLVLALGIGICRIVSGGGADSAGFGVVTLASLFPILAVLSLGVVFLKTVPDPMTEKQFFSKASKTERLKLFADENEMIGYALQNAGFASQMALFDGDAAGMNDFLRRLLSDAELRCLVLGTADLQHLERWAVLKGSESQKKVIFPSPGALSNASRLYSNLSSSVIHPPDILIRNFTAAVKAIIPLCLFFILVLFLIIRDRLQKPDEIILGIMLAVIGMGLFNIGIEMGLSRLGKDVGKNLPSSFTTIHLENDRQIISNFDEHLVHRAIDTNGKEQPFFYANMDNDYVPIPYVSQFHDQVNRQYVYTPVKGPLFGDENGSMGFVVVLIFAFIMGYGATLAEPALNALGIKVEEITVGTFMKVHLMQAVAVGVGVGMLLGVAKIIWDIPIAYLLLPPYIGLLIVTMVSTEEYVNIAWDSAGVTTGPITVPLVLAIGLGVGQQVNVVEGFGILSMASVCPILSVLLVGLYTQYKLKAIRQGDLEQN